MGLDSSDDEPMDVKGISNKFVSMWKEEMQEIEHNLKATKLLGKLARENLKQRNAVKVKKRGDFDLTLGALRMDIDRCIEKEKAGEQYRACLLRAAKISKEVERTFRSMNSVNFYKTAAGTAKDSLKGTLRSTLTHLTKSNAFKMVHLLPDEENKMKLHKSLEEIHGRTKFDPYDQHVMLSSTEELREAIKRGERNSEIVEESFERKFSDSRINDLIRSTEMKNAIGMKVDLCKPEAFEDKMIDWSTDFDTDGSSTTVSSTSGDEIIQRLEAHQKNFARVKELWKLRRKIELDGLGSEKSDDEVLTDFETHEKPRTRL